MNTIEERMAKIEGIVQQINERLNHIEGWIKWLLGIMITMWMTIILTILFKP